MLIVLNFIPDRRSSKNYMGILFRPTLQAPSCLAALPRQLLGARHIKVVVPGVQEDDLASTVMYKDVQIGTKSREYFG